MSEGMKYDGGKLQWSLVMVGMQRALRGVVAAATFGARKYGPDNWKVVQGARNRYMDALYRHLDAVAEKGLLARDADSGFLEMFHVAWNALALAYFASIDDEATRRNKERI